MCFYFAPQLSLTDTSTKPRVSAPGKIIKKPSIMDSHKSLAALWASFSGASSTISSWIPFSCQRRSKSTSLGRRNNASLGVMPYAVLQVVPVVHRRDPRCFV